MRYGDYHSFPGAGSNAYFPYDARAYETLYAHERVGSRYEPVAVDGDTSILNKPASYKNMDVTNNHTLNPLVHEHVSVAGKTTCELSSHGGNSLKTNNESEPLLIKETPIEVSTSISITNEDHSDGSKGSVVEHAIALSVHDGKEVTSM